MTRAGSGTEPMGDEAIRARQVLQMRFVTMLDFLGLPPINPDDFDPNVSGPIGEKVARADQALQRYAHHAELLKALGTIVAECRAGQLRGASLLRTAFDCAMYVQVAQLECTREEVVSWHRGCVVVRIRILLQAYYAGRPDRRDEAELRLLLQGARDPRWFDPPIPLMALGTDAEDLRRFKLTEEGT